MTLPPTPVSAGLAHRVRLRGSIASRGTCTIPSPYAFPQMVLWSAARSGPMAVPGTYHVRLTANGVTETADLVVEKDPRVPEATQADLQKQFDLGLKVSGELGQANTIVSEIRQVRNQVNDRLKTSPDATLQSASQPLLAKMKTIEETIYQVQNRSGQDPLNFPIRLNNYIGALLRVVESGDGAPTAQTYEVDAELSSRLDTQQKAFDAVVANELKKFNERCRRRRCR